MNEIYNKNGFKLSIEEADGAFRMTCEFHTTEAEGTLVFDLSPYGFFLSHPAINTEDPVAFLDLFYASKEGKGIEPGNPPFQIIAYDQGSDGPFGIFKFWEDRTELVKERQIWRKK